MTPRDHIRGSGGVASEARDIDGDGRLDLLISHVQGGFRVHLDNRSDAERAEGGEGMELLDDRCGVLGGISMSGVPITLQESTRRRRRRASAVGLDEVRKLGEPSGRRARGRRDLRSLPVRDEHPSACQFDLLAHQMIGLPAETLTLVPVDDAASEGTLEKVVLVNELEAQERSNPRPER